VNKDVQKFHFAVVRIEVTRAPRGFSAIAELVRPAGNNTPIKLIFDVKQYTKAV